MPFEEGPLILWCLVSLQIVLIEIREGHIPRGRQWQLADDEVQQHLQLPEPGLDGLEEGVLVELHGSGPPEAGLRRRHHQETDPTSRRRLHSLRKGSKNNTLRFHWYSSKVFMLL